MNKITIHDWRKGHLELFPYVTDAYYLGIANKLAVLITNLSPKDGPDKEQVKEWALALAYYFEDVISGIGVWQAFTTKHKALYGKYLPFYEVDEEAYYPDEVNREDVTFILWLCLQKSRKETVINPENPFLLTLSAILYEVLDEEFERVPINEALVEHLKSFALADDFFLIKSLMLQLATQAYLFRPFIDGRREGIDKVIDVYLGETMEQGPRAYAFKTILTFHHTTGPLSLYAKDWLALMLTQWGLEEVAAKVAAIEWLPYDAFLAERYDADYLLVKDPDGRQYKVLREAFEGGCADTLLEQNKVLVSSLVKYDGEWMPNGLSGWYGSTGLFETIVKKRAKMAKALGKEGGFRKPTDKSPLLYFKTTQAYLDWLKKHYSPSETLDLPKDFMGRDCLAVFLPEEGGVVFIPDGAKVIYDKNNPYYDRAFAQEYSLGYLVSDELTPKEMLRYLVEHRMLPDAHMNHVLGPERGLALVQENMDFLARCLRNDDY